MTLERPYKKSKRVSKSPSRKFKREFVVQEHKARTKHWDFRLQVGNKMMSFTVPKGPSLNPKVARLAIETYPHEMDYNKFEGVIAPELYGAGKVMTWDAGKYCSDVDMKEALKRGIIPFTLRGEKLKGKWVLVRTGGKKSKNWLLIKTKDRYSTETVDVIKDMPKSVRSGKTIHEITGADGHITDEDDVGWDIGLHKLKGKEGK